MTVLRLPLILGLFAQIPFPASLEAQNRSVLGLLPVEGRRLEVGDEDTGTLSASDYLSTTDSYLDAWEVTAPVGSSVTVDLRSDDFDAYLYVVGPGLPETLVDDDGAGGCHARIGFTVLENGPYRVVASSLSSRATGTYSITVADTPSSALDHACGDPDPAELSALPTEDRALIMGSVANGSFDFLSATLDGRPVEAWALNVAAGEPISVVQSSDDFDSYLWLIGPDVPSPLGDDDSGGDLDSRIDFTPRTDGPYTVIASTLGERAQGTYTLRVEAPPDLTSLPVIDELVVGQESNGLMGRDDPVVDDGRRGQVWALEGAAGDRISIDLVSDAFDAFLYVVGPGFPEALTDDGGGGGLNSSLTVTLPETGTYRVIASSLDGAASGPYSLRVTAR